MREALGITQEEMARRSRLSAKFLSRIENGHSSPSVEVFARVVELGLGIPLAEFFRSEEDEDRETAAVRALVARQPAAARRRALRLLRVLFDE